MCNLQFRLTDMEEAVTHDGGNTSQDTFLEIAIEKELFNEFENNGTLFYASFPHLFLLGKGLL